MWVLDPTNSPDLLDRLRPHARSPEFEVVWCGEGWRGLIGACHDELAAAFPDYQFFAIKQKWGYLDVQARPRAGDFTTEESILLGRITDRYRAASEETCEWCGRPGSLRSDRREWATLCDACADGTTTMRYPTARPVT